MCSTFLRVDVGAEGVLLGRGGGLVGRGGEGERLRRRRAWQPGLPSCEEVDPRGNEAVDLVVKSNLLRGMLVLLQHVNRLDSSNKLLYLPRAAFSVSVALS